MCGAWRSPLGAVTHGAARFDWGAWAWQVAVVDDGTPKAKESLEGDSLLCLPPENGFRNLCREVAEAGWFDSIVIVLIIASSICLALDVPRLDPESDLKHRLDLLNYWFTGFFIFEMSLKIIAYGFAFTPKAYLKQGWNVLDFCIVMISILGLLANLVPAFGRLKALRILRVLRPLRLLQRFAGMKLIILSLVKTLPVRTTHHALHTRTVHRARVRAHIARRVDTLHHLTPHCL